VKLTSREKRFIWVGAMIVAGVLIFYAIALLPPDREDLSQTVDLKKKMLLKERETLSSEESYRKRLELYGKHLEQDMLRLLPGDNPNVASAELQKILQDFADRSGVEITQKNTLPEKKMQDMLTKVSVSIQANCDLDQLVRFLTAIENYEKLLKVEDFIITSFPSRIQTQKRYEIRPNLTVVGYISSRESKPAEKSANGT
jgi:BarA-like signal transduction histidine kinase